MTSGLLRAKATRSERSSAATGFPTPPRSRVRRGRAGHGLASICPVPGTQHGMAIGHAGCEMPEPVVRGPAAVALVGEEQQGFRVAHVGEVQEACEGRVDQEALALVLGQLVLEGR